MPHIRCFLCDEPLEQRINKKGKPYFVCDPCGTQFFIRRKAGIERLAGKITQSQTQKTGEPEQTSNALLPTEIEQIEDRLKQLPSLGQLWDVFPAIDPHREERKALQERLRQLRDM